MWEQIGAGILSFAGSQIQNAANQNSAESMANFNAGEAAKNREFQREMSDTAYERAVNDLKRAGLNPMLAYSHGGASVPSGSSASGTPARHENALGGAVSSATQAARVSGELEVMKSQSEKNRADASLATAQAHNEGYRPTDEGYPTARSSNVMADTDLKRNVAKMNEAQTAKYEAETRRVGNEIAALAMKYNLDLNHARLMMEQAKSEISKRVLMGAEVRNLSAHSFLMEADKYRAMNEANYSSQAGMLSPALRDISSGVSSGAKAAFTLKPPRSITINR